MSMHSVCLDSDCLGMVPRTSQSYWTGIKISLRRSKGGTDGGSYLANCGDPFATSPFVSIQFFNSEVCSATLASVLNFENRMDANFCSGTARIVTLESADFGNVSSV